MQKSKIPKELQLLTSIFQNILNNPQNKKYRNLNFKRICRQINESYKKWIYNAGFEISSDEKRLVLDSSNIDKVKEVYESLLLITQSYESTHCYHTNNVLNQISEQKLETHRSHIPTNTDAQKYNCELKECLPLEIIGRILKSYQLYLTNIASDEHKHKYTTQQIYDGIGNNYDNVELLDDYNHLLLHHSAAIQFEDICNILRVVVYDGLSCDLETCLLFKRNKRDRQMPDDVLNDLYSNQDHLSQQLIDRIHCHFFHSFDVGFRKTHKESLDIEVKLNNDLQSKLNKYAVCPSNTINKFSSMRYHFGHRFYYWARKQWQLNDDAGMPRIDPHQLLNTRYVKNKYSNFKEELLNNEICSIAESRWSGLYKKANVHLKTGVFREMYCCRGQSAVCYGMIYGQLFHQNHLIALMIYCNFDVLQFKFTETFRKIDEHESNQDLIRRHSNYHFLGRFLREAVECFGMDMPESGYIKAYHGVQECFTFEPLDPHITGPFSITTQRSVAVTFSCNTGMILELLLDGFVWRMGMAEIEGNDALNRLCCFDCQFVSDYSNESEIFCIGGMKKMFINNIIEIATGVDYQFYIKAIHLICMSSCVSYGGVPTVAVATNNKELRMMYALLCHQLFVKMPNHRMAKEFKQCPNYIKTVLNQHCESITYINYFCKQHYRTVLEMKQFKFLDKVLKKENDWLDMQTITKLFPNVSHLRYTIDKDVLFLHEKPSLFELIFSLITSNNTKLEWIDVFLHLKLEMIPKDFCTEMKEYKAKFLERRWWCINLDMDEAMKACHLSDEILNKVWLPKKIQDTPASSSVLLFIIFQKIQQPFSCMGDVNICMQDFNTYMQMLEKALS